MRAAIRAHRTDGPLFRGRFKSIVIERESYLQELVRYIHLNPVEAGVCRTPSGHRWTSHRAYLLPIDASLRRDASLEEKADRFAEQILSNVQT